MPSHWLAPRPSSRCRVRQRRGRQAVVVWEQWPGRRHVRAALSPTIRRRLRRAAESISRSTVSWTLSRRHVGAVAWPPPRGAAFIPRAAVDSDDPPSNLTSRRRMDSAVSTNSHRRWGRRATVVLIYHHRGAGLGVLQEEIITPQNSSHRG